MYCTIQSIFISNTVSYCLFILQEGKDLENLLKTTEARGLPTRGVRRQLLQYYCRTKNLEKAEEIKQVHKGLCVICTFNVFWLLIKKSKRQTIGSDI